MFCRDPDTSTTRVYTFLGLAYSLIGAKPIVVTGVFEKTCVPCSTKEFGKVIGEVTLVFRKAELPIFVRILALSNTIVDKFVHPSKAKSPMDEIEDRNTMFPRVEALTKLYELI